MEEHVQLQKGEQQLWAMRPEGLWEGPSTKDEERDNRKKALR